jgi:hypothetical protein
MIEANRDQRGWVINLTTPGSLDLTITNHGSVAVVLKVVFIVGAQSKDMTMLDLPAARHRLDDAYAAASIASVPSSPT